MFVGPSGLPWWATIVATTAAPTAIFPIQMQTEEHGEARADQAADRRDLEKKAGYAKKTEAGMAEAARAQRS